MIEEERKEEIIPKEKKVAQGKGVSIFEMFDVCLSSFKQQDQKLTNENIQKAMKQELAKKE